MPQICKIFDRGLLDYQLTMAEMEAFTNNRDDTSADQLWVLQHYPVFTQGTSCTDVPEINPANIPVVRSNRGGQITYHGPGQLIVYLLLDIKRLGLGPKRLVNLVEQSLIELLAHYGLPASRLAGAPGVYIDDDKIAALGLRIRRGKCFHGLSINIDMDVTPFDWIEPCGLKGMRVTQLKDHGSSVSIEQVSSDLIQRLATNIGLVV